jgi:transcriptional regulator of acetoin/glycerol metabolism
MLERASEGIAIAKAEGKYKKKEIDMEQLTKLKNDVDRGYLSVMTAAAELGITRKTWYRKVKELESA